MQKSKASTWQIRTDTHFCWIFTTLWWSKHSTSMPTESIPATPLFNIFLIRTYAIIWSLVIHLWLRVGDEVGTRYLDQVPFFFFSACSPGSTVSPYLAALLLLPGSPVLVCLTALLLLLISYWCSREWSWCRWCSCVVDEMVVVMWMRWWWDGTVYVVFIYSSAKYPFDLHHLSKPRLCMIILVDTLFWYSTCITGCPNNTVTKLNGLLWSF
jgi:hypothetical protein